MSQVQHHIEKELSMRVSIRGRDTWTGKEMCRWEMYELIVYLVFCANLRQLWYFRFCRRMDQAARRNNGLQWRRMLQRNCRGLGNESEVYLACEGVRLAGDFS